MESALPASVDSTQNHFEDQSGIATGTSRAKRIVTIVPRQFLQIRSSQNASQLTLNDSGIPVRSLLDVFADTKETIYADPIHCALGEYTTDFEFNHIASRGYRIMSERIAAEVAKVWGIPSR